MTAGKPETPKGKGNGSEKPHDPMINQTLTTGNPISNQTSKAGNQLDYEPGQPVRESNKPEGHAGNQGPQGA
ncbi:hypothetical protein J8J14_04875 [Roseomonas sp. SSH11]|uniref:Uncharacterized protein n=1 Tax=Pararoseomonas baculiformis TaxID=2820812 RepID=A0ABS4AAS4_9PROT|nr:hypothetical protein [Pararoseomonas baculiformis]MBP0444104.1 hypothetical protein [Pararoseomonas baculiformis]